MRSEKMENKIFKFSIKELTDDGKLWGYLSTFGNLDAGGDIVDRGAFTKTLQENNAFPLIWAHSIGDPSLIVGSFSAKEDEDGLFIEAEFFMDLEPAKQAYNVVKKLFLKKVKIGLSMGYKAIKWIDEKLDNSFVRRLKEVQLVEGSLTLFPMNNQALVQDVKTGDNGYWEYKPYPNEHSARLRDPDDFDPDTFRRKNDGTIYGKTKVPGTVAVIWGKLKGHSKPSDQPIPQALRFPTDDWTAETAKKWLKDNNVKYISFEAAKAKSAPGDALGIGEPDTSTPQAEPQDEAETKFLSDLKKIIQELKSI